jgi:hypothetical protein
VVLALVGAAALAPAAPGQARVNLNVLVDEAYAGEPFEVEIEVANFQECEAPVFPESDAFKVTPTEGGSEQTSLSIINGRARQTRTRTFRFEITPAAPGELSIPPVSVNVDGKVLRTRATRVTVQKRDATEELLLAEISVDAERIWVGQEVRARLTIYVKPARVGTTLVPGRDMYSFLDVNNLRPFPAPQRVETVTRTDAHGAAQTYYAYPTEADIVAGRPGPLTFDDLAVRMDYPTRFVRDIFGDLRVAARRRLEVVPTVLKGEVLALPTEGRPAEFTGAVGQFEIRVSASPTSVRVGDPIELTMDVTGVGPLESLPPPPLASINRLTQSFRIPQETLAGEVSGNRKRFKQVIRPARADVMEIPPIEYVYFDPKLGRYATARSEPIPLSVAPAESVDIAPAPEPDASAARNAQPTDGLRGYRTRENELLAVRRDVTMRVAVLATFAPPAAFAALWGFAALVRSRGGDVARARRQRALRSALARIRQAPAGDGAAVARAIQAAVAGYLADRLNEPAARLAGRAAVEALTQRSAAPALRNRLAQLLEQCEAASFGAMSAADAGELARSAEGLLHELEGQRL